MIPHRRQQWKATKQSGKCQEKHFSSGNVPSRRSTSLCLGCGARYTKKLHVSLRRFGVTFAVDLRTICSVKNFSKAWIEGSTYHKTSNIVEHARSDQHKGAMIRLRQEQARKRQEPITAYTNIARRITVMDNATKERIKRKFDISFVLAKENLAFTKYPLIYKLEQRHGVDLGQAYQGRESAQIFAHYIAQSQRREFHRNLTSQF